MECNGHVKESQRGWLLCLEDSENTRVIHPTQESSPEPRTRQVHPAVTHSRTKRSSQRPPRDFQGRQLDSGHPTRALLIVTVPQGVAIKAHTQMCSPGLRPHEHRMGSFQGSQALCVSHTACCHLVSVIIAGPRVQLRSMRLMS